MTASSLSHARILLGVTGGIAAYKSADLCRRLVKAGARVRVIMTESATRFVAPLTFETLSGHPVYVDMFDPERGWEIEHISYAHWGQALVIAPATANTLAKMAAGLADDPLTTTVLAFRGPLVVAPAMNTAMWEHPQTQENIQALAERDAVIVRPDSGELACGDVGTGRLAELEIILASVEAALSQALAEGPLAGKRVLITAGPTAEPIDPVRHLSNPSTGRMGFALADEAKRRGARVTLICGPTALAPPEDLSEVVRVGPARQMRDAVLERLGEQDILVFCAAVADYAPASPQAEKIKKDKADKRTTLELVRTPDIAAEANAVRQAGQIFLGFAAETSDLIENARAKMKTKGFDFLAANQVSTENPAFASASNQATLLSHSGEQLDLPSLTKEDLAAAIWDFVLAGGD